MHCNDLVLRWSACFPAGPQDAVETAGGLLLARWEEPHRRYHDLRHLAEVLDRVDELASFATSPDAVALAAFFHDAVYQGRPGADEQASANLARDVLVGLASPHAKDVARLVLLTAGHQVQDGDADGAVLCDADLWVLSAPAERYAQYTADVRAEYAHVPERAFSSGRIAVLRALLERPLYRTATARLWEARARANVLAEIADLERSRPT